MTGGPLRYRPSPNTPTSLLLVLLVAGICGLMMSPGYLGSSTSTTPHGVPSARAPTVADREVAAATLALNAPFGPFPSGGPCTVTGSQVSCPASPRHVVPLTSTNASPPRSWTDLTSFAGGPPSGRWIASMVWDPVDHYVLLFGGYGSYGDDSDTWAFVNNSWTQISTGSSPSGRYAAGIAWDYTDGYAVLFGGTYSGATVLNDTWTYVGGVWKNITGTTNQTPGGRWRQAMTWDPADGYVLMFGGTNALASAYSDTWSFVNGNWTKLTVSGSPPGRYRAGMAWDTADNYAVLFGGCTTSACPDSSTWTYVNSTWTSVSASTHPSARVYFGITYSTYYDHVILFGGSSSGTSNSPLGDTWAFANGSWAKLSNLSRSPAAIAYLTMAYDPVDNYSVMFGGQWSNGTFSDQVWVLGPSMIGTLRASPAAIDLGQSTSLNATPYAYSNYVTYNYTELPTGCTTQNVSVLSCTPTVTGAFSLAAVLNDSSGYPTTVTGSLQVNADPFATGFTVNRSTVTAGASVQFAVGASGGTGTYSYKYTGLPPGCGSANIHNLTCTPGSTASGVYHVVATVTDQAGFQLSQSLNLTVNPTPTLKVVTVKPSVIDVGMTADIWANLTAGTGTGPFTYAYSGLPTGCATSNASMLPCAPSAPGFSAVQVTVTDVFGFTTSGSVNLTVNVAPTVSSSALLPSPIDVGIPFTIWVNATGGTGSLTYHYSGGPSGCSYGNHSQITCTPTAPGNYTITATATDLVGYAATTQLNLTINPGYESVGLTASSTNLDVGQNLTVTMQTRGGTGPYSYAWTGVPAGCPLTTQVSNFTCRMRSAGTYIISVTGSDRWGTSVNGGVQVIVNPAPAVTAFAASANPASVGSGVVLTLTVSGGSGVYTIAYSRLPSGCVSANTTTLHCTPNKSGNYNITATVIDSLGAETSAYLLLTVGSGSSSAGGLGSSTLLYIVIAVVVVAVIAGVGVFLMRRRRAAPAGEPPAAEDEGTWQEPPENPQ